MPQFKLFVVGNHKPRLRSVDEAIRRRLNLLPFMRRIPERERDKHLSEKLRAEAGGILRWMVEGCLAWQRHGLQPPESIRQATEGYFAAEDSLANWIEDCCDVKIGASANRTALFKIWQNWCLSTNERAGTASEFYYALVSKLETVPLHRLRHVQHIACKTAQYDTK